MEKPEPFFGTSALKPAPDYLAPDTSEIRLLLTVTGGGLCHCTLPAGRTTLPMQHRRVEEIWYVLEGEGEMWRKSAASEDTVRLSTGVCLAIPPRTAFQFRNGGAGPLRVLIATMPPWPGPEEAEATLGIWPAAADASPGSPAKVP